MTAEKPSLHSTQLVEEVHMVHSVPQSVHVPALSLSAFALQNCGVLPPHIVPVATHFPLERQSLAVAQVVHEVPSMQVAQVASHVPEQSRGTFLQLRVL